MPGYIHVFNHQKKLYKVYKEISLKRATNR